MGIPKVSVFVLLALALFLLTAGCTQQDASGTMTDLKIGYQPSTHQMAHAVAMEKGWWQEELAPYGITNVTDYVFPTGAPEMAAMLSGDIDVAYVGAAPFLTAVSAGLDGKIVAAVNTQGSDLVLRTGLDYSGPQSLKGLKIATFQAGTIQDTILRNWLTENGLDPDNDLEIVAMGPGDAVTAITAGKVDAVFLPHPSPAVIEAEGAGKTVVRSGEMYPNHPCCVLVVSGSLIREHPEIVEQIIKTHLKAIDYIEKNPDDAAAIYAEKTSSNLEDVKLSLREWDGSFNADPDLIVDPVMDYATIQYNLGYIKKQLTQDEVFDLSFYKKATS